VTSNKKNNDNEVVSVAAEDSLILEIDPKKLNEILNNLRKDYEDGKILINPSPSGFGYLVHSSTEKELMEEFQLTEEYLSKLMDEIMLFTMSLVMGKEERVFEKFGEAQEVKDILAKLRHQLKNLVESLRFKSFCKTQYLEDFSWDISIRVRQTGGIKMQFPFSVIRMSFSRAGSSLPPPLREDNSITFECTLQDIERMIESLEEAKNALTELQKEEG
jgi:hypothetical protein